MFDRKKYQKEYNKKYQEDNKEARKKYLSEYYQKNIEKFNKNTITKEKQKEYRDRFYENNPDFKKTYRAKYQKDNKESMVAYRKKYNSLDRVKKARKLHSQKRRALKRTTADGSITLSSLDELLLSQKNKCYHCDTLLDDKKHLDHYIPISKGGTHTIGNVVWSCEKCNLKKGGKQLDTLLLV